MEIVIKNLSFTANNNKILKNINLEVEENKITGIIGHSGAGKTTLAEVICGVKVPTEGEIHIFESVLSKKTVIKKMNEFRKNIGYSYQYSDEQFFTKTVREEIELVLKNYKYTKEQIDYKIKELMEMFNFTKEFLDKNPLKLSNGEKRLVVIASSIAHNPRLVILDEPTVGLDAENKKNIINIIKKLRDEYSKTIIVISHDIDLLIKFANNIAVLDHGELILSGKKMDVFTNTEVFNKYNIKLPTIIKFSEIVRTKSNKKIGYYDDIKDLMKAVYRNV